MQRQLSRSIPLCRLDMEAFIDMSFEAEYLPPAIERSYQTLFASPCAARNVIEVFKSRLQRPVFCQPAHQAEPQPPQPYEANFPILKAASRRQNPIASRS